MEQIRERYEAHCEARERARLRAHAGLDPGAELGEIDDRFADLTSGEPLEKLRAEHEAHSLASERESRRRLIVQIEDSVLAARGWVLAAELRAHAGRSDPRALDELREEWFAKLGDVRQQLGYADGRARFEALHAHVDIEAWARGADRLLEATEPAYRDRIGPALGRAGVAPDEATLADVEALLGSSVCDSLFPAERLAACLDFTTEGLGLTVERAPGVWRDDEPRAGRLAGVSTFGVRVPGDIAISGVMSDGLAAHADHFAAAGRAFAAAFTSADLPVERRRGLDPALAFGFGLLLSDRLHDPSWIDRGPAQQRGAELAAENELRRLARLRGNAGRLRFELALARVPAGRDPHALAERWAEECTNALGVTATPAGYLASTDAELASLHELRGRSFAVQMADWLRERHGRRFWEQRQAGELLKELWHTGSTYSAEALASELGFGPLDPDLLLDSALRPA